LKPATTIQQIRVETGLAPSPLDAAKTLQTATQRSEFDAILLLVPVHVFYNPPVRLLLFIVFVLASSETPWWQVQTSGIDTNLRGVSVTTDEHSGKHRVWASGSNGVILSSTGDNKGWTQLHVAGGETLDFRDIEAFGDRTAYLMSSGDGEKSRIYKTTNAGQTWELQHTDKRPGFFLDALACDSATHCFALSDPVDGKFLILTTDDGQHWKELPGDKMPAALPTEGAFAASGTSIAICQEDIYFATGGPAARIFHSRDRGRSWTATETPVASGNASSGIFSVACHAHNLVAVGGDYKDPTTATKVAIYSKDSGAHWHLAEQQPGGYRSAVVFLSDNDLAAVGPNGTDITHDGGIHWTHTDALNQNAASFAANQAWAVGPKGTIARFNPHMP
jgi:photosystem II stability/assembly factor-like uncharacterized protein